MIALGENLNECNAKFSPWRGVSENWPILAPSAATFVICKFACEDLEMFGVEITYKSGKKDWVDPVTDEPVVDNGTLIVTNNHYSYEYKLSDLDKWFKYDLCKKCNYDVRTHNCSKDECFNTSKYRGDL